MHIRSLILASVAMLGMIGGALAGPFETANAYYSGKYGVPDFTFTKSEFGKTALGQNIHLAGEVIVETIFGATVVYIPGSPEVLVFEARGTNSEAKEAKTYGGNSSCFGTYGMEIMHAGQPLCLPGSSVGSASTSVYQVQVGTIAAVPRSCSFDAASDGKDVHSC